MFLSILSRTKWLLTLEVLLLFTSAIFAQSCSESSPCKTLQGGQTFKTPDQVVSSGGRLQTSLLVDVTEFQVDWLNSLRRLYNNSFPSPTLRIKPGDVVSLNLINNLQEPDFSGAAINELRHPNTTNVHTHGLHISSKAPQDDVFLEIGPTQSYSYKYNIDDEQARGTYWYHPHFHGSSYFQVLGGMAGMIVVEDNPAEMSTDLDAVSCPNNCENDLQMVLQLFQYSTDEDGSFSVAQEDLHDYEGFRLNNITVDNSSTTLEEWLEDPTNEIKYVLVNGLLQPTLVMQPGQVKRFRLLNAGGLYALAVHLVNTNDGSSCTVKEIALDGMYLDQPRDLGTGRSVLFAASRVDWLVKCPIPGTYELRSTFLSDDHLSMGEHPSFNGTLLTLVVNGSEVLNSAMPSTLPSRPSYASDLRDVTEKDIDSRFVVEVTPTDTIGREDFSESNIRYKARVNTIQEWHLVNTEYVTSHPIHMHVNHMQVISYNPYIGPYGVDDGGSNWKLFGQNGTGCTWQHQNYDKSVTITSPSDALNYLGHDEKQSSGGLGTIGYAQIGEHRDTILVPPLGNITVRFRTHKYTGPVVVHCHLQSDADQGMMMTTEIVDEGASVEASITSAGAYPSSCFRNDPVYQPGNDSPPSSSVTKSLLLPLVVLELLYYNLP
ncbi:unnamed protein product [Clavelina lepadiformis]|uniref:Laccase n=1 Tax=Clavelina lepadiformis TaxID=159417 RepID=A0ABP0GCL5_CLALP